MEFSNFLNEIDWLQIEMKTFSVIEQMSKQ